MMTKANLQKTIIGDLSQIYRLKLLYGEVPIWDLSVTKHLSKNTKRYRQHVSQIIAAEQLMKEDADVHAGNNIRFLFTHAESKLLLLRQTSKTGLKRFNRVKKTEKLGKISEDKV